MLDQMLLETVQSHGEKTAIVCDRTRMSYRELYDKVLGFSQGLQSIGISQGDCVALILPDCPEFAIAFYAVAKIHGITLPINPRLAEDEMAFYISDSKARAIVTDLKRAEVCRKIASQLDLDIQLIVIDEREASSLYFYNLIDPQAIDQTIEGASAENEALYQYSSGSTGRPKRVARTQKNLVCEAKDFTATVSITAEDKILCIVPLFHAHGFGNCLLAATCTGATLVILEQTMKNGLPIDVPFIFRRPRILELIEQEKITILPVVPYMVNMLAETPDDGRADLSTLRLCFSAGNFLPKETYDKFLARFGISVSQLYGCTEAGSVTINLESSPDKYNSIGLPMKNVEVRIIDEQGNELPQDAIGEMMIKSPALTRGYYNRPELNKEAFIDGCFLSGDLGKKDADGNLYITGRKKIFIDTGGHKVDPIEIEDILVTHPLVREAVVVGVKGAYAGELVKAVIVPEGTCQEQEILTYCQDKLAEFKIPKIVEFRDEMPKSPIGKILRKKLVE